MDTIGTNASSKSHSAETWTASGQMFFQISSLTDSRDIKKLGRVLKIIKYTMPILGLVPVHVMLKMFAFSEDFGNKMVFPLVTLFLGTGSQTPNVSCAILESLFVDPNMGMGL